MDPAANLATVIARLRRRFIEEAPPIATALEAYAAQPTADFPPELRLHVHRLAGTAGTFDFWDIGDMAGTLEGILASPDYATDSGTQAAAGLTAKALAGLLAAIRSSSPD